MIIINRAKRKEKRRIKEEERKAKYQARRDRLEADVVKYTADMLSKPCALRHDFMNCTDSCAHFKKGRVFDVPRFLDDDIITPMMRYPKCKLWK